MYYKITENRHQSNQDRSYDWHGSLINLAHEYATDYQHIDTLESLRNSYYRLEDGSYDCGDTDIKAILDSDASNGDVLTYGDCGLVNHGNGDDGWISAIQYVASSDMRSLSIVEMAVSH